MACINISRNSLKWIYAPHGEAICVIGPFYEEAEAITFGLVWASMAKLLLCLLPIDKKNRISIHAKTKKEFSTQNKKRYMHATRFDLKT